MQNFNNINFKLCASNYLYFQHKEDVGNQKIFRYDMKYPVIYNLKNSPNPINPTILANINSTLLEDVFTFRQGLLEEAEQYNKEITDKSSIAVFKAISNYDITMNKNYVLSIIISFMGFMEENKILYDQINNYNYDLETGNILTLSQVFKPNVNYKKLINSYINKEISKSPELFFDGIVVNIPDDQSFYLTDDGIIIYFGIDEIAPISSGIPHFKISYDQYGQYIRNRYTCTPSDISLIQPK